MNWGYSMKPIPEDVEEFTGRFYIKLKNAFARCMNGSKNVFIPFSGGLDSRTMADISSIHFIITLAQEKDVPEILEIMKTANMHYIPSPEMPELDWRHFFVAKVNGEIVGAAGYQILSATEAKTTLLAVHPDYRKHGIGKMLQERRMLAMSDQDIKTLTTNADIPETIAWYKKHFGYKETGKLKKIHEFGRPDIDEWTTLQTDLVEWRKRHDEQRKG